MKCQSHVKRKKSIAGRGSGYPLNAHEIFTDLSVPLTSLMEQGIVEERLQRKSRSKMRDEMRDELR